MAAGDETWLDLEKLAARIYAELEPACQVEHDAHLQGQVSERSRQVDVLIRSQTNDSLVVVDCKDRQRKVNVNDAFTFAGLLEDVGATGGVLICNRGFSKAARTVAKKKGFALCQLHDVESRKWQVEVQVPLIWTSLRLSSLQLGIDVWLDAGDSLSTSSAPRFLKEHREIRPLDLFVQAWNGGELSARQPGEYTATVIADLETLDGVLRRNAHVTFTYVVAGHSRLGYVTPQESRGILDVEDDAYTTVTLDIGKTVAQEPADGWREIFDPDDLAISHRGTVISLDEVSGIEARWLGIDSARLLRKAPAP